MHVLVESKKVINVKRSHTGPMAAEVLDSRMKRAAVQSYRRGE